MSGMNIFPRQTVYGTQAQALTAAGDLVKIQPSRPIIVTDWGITFTTSGTGTNGVATGNLRPTAGSTVGQTVGASAAYTSPTGQAGTVDTAGGAMTLTGGSANIAAGKQLAHRIYPEPAPGGLATFGATGNQGGGTGLPGNNMPGSGVVSSTGPQGVQVNPGQEFAVNLGTALGTAGAGTPFITYYELPAVGDSTISGAQNYESNVTFQQS